MSSTTLNSTCSDFGSRSPVLVPIYGTIVTYFAKRFHSERTSRIQGVLSVARSTNDFPKEISMNRINAVILAASATLAATALGGPRIAVDWASVPGHYTGSTAGG